MWCCHGDAVNDYTGVHDRERLAGLYRLSAYYLAITTNEIPATVLVPTSYVIINYWMVNLMPSLVNFAAHWLIVVLSAFTAQVGYSRCVTNCTLGEPWFAMADQVAFIAWNDIYEVRADDKLGIL